MNAIRIEGLARVMIEELAPTFGHRPEAYRIEGDRRQTGEKMYEELLNQEETRRTLELTDYFVVLPAFKNLYRNIAYDYTDIISDSYQSRIIRDNDPCCQRRIWPPF